MGTKTALPRGLSRKTRHYDPSRGFFIERWPTRYVHRLAFPFWVVLRTHNGAAVDVCAPPRYAATFSSTTKAGDLMQEQGGLNWEFRMVIRSTLPDLIAELRKEDFEGLSYDPAPDGSEGTLISLIDLETQAEIQ